MGAIAVNLPFRASSGLFYRQALCLFTSHQPAALSLSLSRSPWFSRATLSLSYYSPTVHIFSLQQACKARLYSAPHLRFFYSSGVLPNTRLQFANNKSATPFYNKADYMSNQSPVQFIDRTKK